MQRSKVRRVVKSRLHHHMRESGGPRVGENMCVLWLQVRKEGGNQYLDMVSAIESEVAELHSSTATGAPL